VNAFAFAVVQLVQLVQGYQPMLQQLGVLLEIIENMSPFGSAAAAAFFLKRSCSRLVTEKSSLLFIGSHLFSALETQYLQSKNYMLFLHCSRNCTVQ
jgi:hypothetical protein